MNTLLVRLIVGAAAIGFTQVPYAGTRVFFNPLTQSTSVASTANHVNELKNPWQVPAGLSQINLLSLSKVEADTNQSILRVPAGTASSMFDMVSFDPAGKYLFIPHETPFGAGVSRYNMDTKVTEVLFAGDQNGVNGDWSKDYGAFDPSRFTPNGTVIASEEWAGQGRTIEIMNPMDAPSNIKIRELDSIANVSHEGIGFSKKFNNVIYFADEFNSGSVYKFVMTTPGDYTKGQTFVLKTDGYNGKASDMWNEPTNSTQVRTGLATWIPLTDKNGAPLTQTSPFKNGEPELDPRVDATNALGGRVAADEVNATPFGRPEDIEIGKHSNGNEIFYIAMTSENAVYSFEVYSNQKVNVRVFASEASTPKNLGFPATTGVMNSPDNLAIDALGNIYIIEDAPNSSSVGGDIWMARDVNSNGVAESLDHFMSLQVNGSEATGMIFNPVKPTQFVVAVQHPSSTDLVAVPKGFGDSIWQFDMQDVVPPLCEKHNSRHCAQHKELRFADLLKKAGGK